MSDHAEITDQPVSVELFVAEQDDGTQYIGIRMIDNSNNQSMALGMLPDKVRELVAGLNEMIVMVESGRLKASKESMN